MSDETAIITAEFELAKTGLSALGTPEMMRKHLDDNSQRLAVVHQYIADNFKPGIDFGKAYDEAKKDSLLKPGAEKICKLFNTTPRWRRDNDTWEMLGKPAGVVCLVCEIIDNATGNIIGEGRGAEKVGNKSRDANKTIKIAEKCSLVDAALYTFNLSSIFTQDMPTKENVFKQEKSQLWDDICAARIGENSSMKNSEFFRKVAFELCEGEPTTVGAIRGIRKAVLDDGLYDLSTGERIPQ